MWFGHRITLKGVRERTLRCPECGGQNRYALVNGGLAGLSVDPCDLPGFQSSDLEMRVFLQELSEFPLFVASGPDGGWPDTFA